MIYLTGDTHGDFRRVAAFCDKADTAKDDILVILGDAGLNYYGNPKDKRLKQQLSELPITLFCIHGNHEKRPEKLPAYIETDWHGGNVYIEPDFPSLLFAKDGEFYELDGKRCVAIGGAYSVDKYHRLANNWGWWPRRKSRRELKAVLMWRAGRLMSSSLTPARFDISPPRYSSPVLTKTKSTTARKSGWGKSRANFPTITGTVGTIIPTRRLTKYGLCSTIL